jgi:hypothetical protein
MLLAPPEPAADLRRYLWDAHLVRAGLSPYAVVPSDPAFAQLRTAENWPVNNPDVPSPYPPGAQLFFLAATTLGESARAIKLAALLCDALLALVVWRSLVAARTGLSLATPEPARLAGDRPSRHLTWPVPSPSPAALAPQPGAAGPPAVGSR